MEAAPSSCSEQDGCCPCASAPDAAYPDAMVWEAGDAVYRPGRGFVASPRPCGNRAPELRDFGGPGVRLPALVGAEETCAWCEGWIGEHPRRPGLWLHSGTGLLRCPTEIDEQGRARVATPRQVAVAAGEVAPR
ncbi:hypothetical protein GCM10012275_63460 [Longimycelium tulufanense]|uniref:Uncharacterized protein n=1 Tax=Longimycelium tulufanense TaxID=907463 RepID=A0A8J3CJ42_9PSEU|nr:hypothetical protein GCM10012275_63460 [Longimycelium tulufanense]